MRKESQSLTWINVLHEIVVATSELQAATTGDGKQNSTRVARTKLKLLIEVLYRLVNLDCEHATSILSTHDVEVNEGAGNGGDVAEWMLSVIPLLSAGLSDKVIAQRLNISASTLSRRISDLMSIYDVHTRFQLGLQIARLKAVASHRFGDTVTPPEHTHVTY